MTRSVRCVDLLVSLELFPKRQEVTFHTPIGPLGYIVHWAICISAIATVIHSYSYKHSFIHTQWFDNSDITIANNVVCKMYINYHTNYHDIFTEIIICILYDTIITLYVIINSIIPILI